MDFMIPLRLVLPGAPIPFAEVEARVEEAGRTAIRAAYAGALVAQAALSAADPCPHCENPATRAVGTKPRRIESPAEAVTVRRPRRQCTRYGRRFQSGDGRLREALGAGDAPRRCGNWPRSAGRVGPTARRRRCSACCAAIRSPRRRCGRSRGGSGRSWRRARGRCGAGLPSEPRGRSRGAVAAPGRTGRRTRRGVGGGHRGGERAGGQGRRGPHGQRTDRPCPAGVGRTPLRGHRAGGAALRAAPDRGDPTDQRIRRQGADGPWRPGRVGCPLGDGGRRPTTCPRPPGPGPVAPVRGAGDVFAATRAPSTNQGRRGPSKDLGSGHKPPTATGPPLAQPTAAAPAGGAEAEVGAVAPVVGGEQASPNKHATLLCGQETADGAEANGDECQRSGAVTSSPIVPRAPRVEKVLGYPSPRTVRIILDAYVRRCIIVAIAAAVFGEGTRPAHGERETTHLGAQTLLVAGRLGGGPRRRRLRPGPPAGGAPGDRLPLMRGAQVCARQCQ